MAAYEVHRRPVAGEVVARGDAVEVAGPARARRMAGQDAVDRDEVIALRVRHRAYDGEPAGAGGQQGQVLAEVDARHRRRDGPELAADALRGLGLHVEGVVLAEAAAQEDDDHRPRAARRVSAPAARPASSPGRLRPSSPENPAWTKPRRVSRMPSVGDWPPMLLSPPGCREAGGRGRSARVAMGSLTIEGKGSKCEEVRRSFGRRHPGSAAVTPADGIEGCSPHALKAARAAFTYA